MHGIVVLVIATTRISIDARLTSVTNQVIATGLGLDAKSN